MAKKKNKKEEKAVELINNPHDKFFKALFSMLLVVQDYFEHLLPIKPISKAGFSKFFFWDMKTKKRR